MSVELVHYDDDLTVYCGEAFAAIRDLPGASVDAVVTSPPYADVREDVPHILPGNWPLWIEGILAELSRVLKPTGGVLLNVGRAFRDGAELPIGEQAAERAASLGYVRLDTIIWHKPNGRPIRPYLVPRHEYVYWLGLTPGAYRGYDETRQPYTEESLGRFGRSFFLNRKGEERAEHRRRMHPDGALPGSVFTGAVGRGRHNPHPTPMAQALADHLVPLGCPPGGTVLDPFLGSGTTAISALNSGRRCIGIDVEERWCRLAIERTSARVLT